MKISSRTSSRSDPLRETLERYLGPGGLLAEQLDGYESRPQQIDMALAVGRVIQRSGRAVLEAGTGTGKTLSYLIPAVLSGKKTLVSTATKNLQEQIYFKDIELIRQLGFDIPVAYLKGRANYLCRFRFERFLMAPLFRSSEDGDHFDRIVEWAERTESGDRAELHDLPDNYASWLDLSTTPESCLGLECPDYDDCFVTRVRKRAARAQVIIVNHHLFFGDLAVRGGGYGEVLPDVEVVIFDEAHHLEQTATSFFGRIVSLFRFRDLHADLERALRDLHQPPADLVQSLSVCDQEANALFKLLGNRLPKQDKAELSSQTRGNPDVMRNTQRVLSILTQLQKQVQFTTSLGELAAVFARRCGELRDDLAFILEAKDNGWVYFSQRRGHHRRVFLHACPIDLTPVFSDLLYPTHSTTIFTSATLAVGGEFHYFRSRISLGLEQPVSELKLDSSFDFMQQALLFVPKGLPEPNHPEYVRAVAPVVESLLNITKGRAFVLFTSYRNMNALYEHLADGLPYPLLVQGQRSKTALISAFRETPSVLLATASFWEGVDVPGQNLSLVIMDRLPFSSPADPVLKARINYIREQGGDPFHQYQLPQAAIALKQGFGRLIRHREDRGIVAVLDRRVIDRSYGQVFLNTLPPTRITRELDEVRAWWRSSPDTPLETRTNRA